MKTFRFSLMIIGVILISASCNKIKDIKDTITVSNQMKYKIDGSSKDIPVTFSKKTQGTDVLYIVAGASIDGKELLAITFLNTEPVEGKTYTVKIDDPNATLKTGVTSAMTDNNIQYANTGLISTITGSVKVTDYKLSTRIKGTFTVDMTNTQDPTKTSHVTEGSFEALYLNSK
jgi:hypothetical protein